jgi:hypothetical protein
VDLDTAPAADGQALRPRAASECAHAPVLAAQPKRKRAAAELPESSHEPAGGRGRLEAATRARVVRTAP